MFAELDLLVKSTTVQIIIAAEGDQMRVNVIPKAVDGQNPALSTPLSLVATPAELDEQFSELLTKYTGKRQSLAEQLENAELVMEAAQKEAQSKATAKPSKTKPAASISVNVASDVEDEEGLDENFGDAPKITPSAAPTPKANTVELDLFD